MERRGGRSLVNPLEARLQAKPPSDRQAANRQECVPQDRQVCPVRISAMRRSKVITRLLPVVPISILLAVWAAPPKPEPDVAARQDYGAIARTLGPFIEHELREKDLPAISVALVDDQQIVWARGFGLADPEKKIPATAQTVYRVGSEIGRASCRERV